MVVITKDNDNVVEYLETTSGTVVKIKKDDTEVNVQQITSIEFSGGQTWKIIKAYLDTKI